VPKLEKAAALQLKMPEPHTLLADAYLQLGQKAEATKSGRKPRDLGPAVRSERQGLYGELWPHRPSLPGEDARTLHRISSQRARQKNTLRIIQDAKGEVRVADFRRDSSRLEISFVIVGEEDGEFLHDRLILVVSLPLPGTSELADGGPV